MTGPSPLVGRDSALEQAQAVLDEAMSGAGQLLLVSGEPGIGKSVLLADLARRAREHGALVLRGNCRDGADTPPYWPWIQVLRGSPGPSQPMPSGGGGSAGEAADARFSFFDAIGLYLAKLASSAPVLVVLDDLQWADQPSIQLLEFLAGQLSAARVLLLGAVRDTEPVEWSPGLKRQVLPLEGLDAASVADLIAAVAGSRPSAQQADDIRRRCGGNPFFIRELTRLMLTRGGWDLGPESSPVPEGVLETLTARLGRLSPACQELLGLAAVDGWEIWPQLVARASGLQPQLVADLLDEAVAARVVTREGASWRFSHDLFRDAVAADLAQSRRSQVAHLHLAVGEALRELAGPDLPLAGGAARLAAHFVAAGAQGRAIEYSVLAAREATSRLGHADAVRHYEIALHLLDAADERRTGLLLELAAAQDRAGDGEAARLTYAHLIERARRIRDQQTLARAALGSEALGRRAGSQGARALLREAADALNDQEKDQPENTESIVLRSKLLSALARSYRHGAWGANELDPAAEPAAAEAVRLAKVSGDKATLAHALLAAHDVAWAPGTALQRLPLIDAMAEAAARAGDADLAADAQQLRASALIEVGDPQGRAELIRYIEQAELLGHARGRWGALSRRATLAQMEGRVQDAIELSAAALRIGDAIGIPDAAGCFSSLRAALTLLGAPSAGLGLIPPSDPLWPIFPILEAAQRVSGGDLEQARVLIAGFAIETLPEKYDLEFLMIAAVVSAAAGSPSQRDAIVARLAPRAGLHVVVGGCASYHGPVDHVLGMLAAASGDKDAAAEHFTAAAASCDRLGVPAWASLSHRARADLKEPRQQGNVFRAEAGVWLLKYGGAEAHLPDAKGLGDLAALLAVPGQEIHALELLGQPIPAGSGDPVLDERARTEYLNRLNQLDHDISSADAKGDQHASDRAHAERKSLLRGLSAATGLGGRRRKLGDDAERARKTVSARIHDVMNRIERAHPPLAAHLRQTVSTGTTCAYRPDHNIHWSV